MAMPLPMAITTQSSMSPRPGRLRLRINSRIANRSVA